ncbi:hypothetical protein GYMLUDRAFT_48525 [Collybiopsis luxurians FD-317 M1]|uniref:Unplaced genomic scaffold GYMLUscaffold_66, whole genome shotgun sequence n=1 Tax=Collybiopsis luxurians FD-317 M1 TaxID=944289 RepID=A0A0D0C9G4_9AGAR|nr:hypothetical protein GYMLUDRAFT_48525 [Collybiopsis luxurians FD-317 M1]
MVLQPPLQLISWAAFCSLIILVFHVLMIRLYQHAEPHKFREILIRVDVQVVTESSFENETRAPDGETEVFSASVKYNKSQLVFSSLILFNSLAIFALQVAEITLQKSSFRHEGSVFGVNTEQIADGMMLSLAFAYSFCLAFFALICDRTPRFTRHQWSTILRMHNTAILLVALAVYGIRDVYPLATYSKRPSSLDSDDSGLIPKLLWVKIGLLALTSVVIPLISPRIWVPAELGVKSTAINKVQGPNPEQVASPLSILFFTFLDNVIWKAFRVTHLPAKELPHLADTDHVGWLKHLWFPYLEKYSSAFKGPETTNDLPKRKRSMAWTLVWMFRWTWIQMAAGMVVLACGNLGSPIAMNQLLAFLETGSSNTDIRPWVWIILLFISPVAVTLSMEWYLRLALRLNVQLEALLTQLIFEHALRIRVKADPPNAQSNSNVSSTSSGKIPGKKSLKTKSQAGLIHNLVTTDLYNISELRNWILIFVQRPLEFAFSIVFLSRILDLGSTLVGIGSMILLAPIPAKVINVGRKLFRERMRKTDSRVEIFSDVMAVLRMIKLFGWEAKMSQRVDEIRGEELIVVRKRKVYQMFSELVNYTVPLISTLIMKRDLTPSRVFASLVVFERLQQIVRYMFVNLNRYYTGLISIGRMEDYLWDTELIDSSDASSKAAVLLDSLSWPERVNEDYIGFRNATFSWAKGDKETLDAEQVPEGSQMPLQARNFFLNISDEVVFHRDCINLIIGPTGSGKTAMLLALLGEMHYIPDSSSLQDSWYHLPRSKGVAYAAQESWVLNETIRENILFHSPYDEDRYRKVLFQCGLKHDLALFDAGDLTEIGEKGLTLSGGQKARLTLARAVYSEAKILLLDDVLAALDVHTSKHIVGKCLLGDLMQGRTIILVTHNTALTLPIATFVVTMKDGQVASQEVRQFVQTSHAESAVAREAAEIVGAPNYESAESLMDDDAVGREGKFPDAKKNLTAGGKLVMDEEVPVGHVSWAAVKLYAIGLGGRFPILFFITWLGGNIISQLTVVFQTWYLGFWASQYEGREPGDVPVLLYLAGYGAIVISTVIVNCFTSLNYIYGTVRAADYIHKRLVDSILGTTMRWLDKTPLSRIMTRFTQDINIVDIGLASTLRDFTDVCIRLLSRLGAVILFSPIFLLPGLVILVTGMGCASVYFKAQMSVKREMSIAKAPVLGHFGSTIAGLTSIRAYGAQELSITEMQLRTDRHSRTARIFNNLQRWMAVRINILSAVFTTSLAWYLVYVLHQSASVTGFSLNMGVSFSGAIFSFVLQFNVLEARSTLERIESYLTIEQEAKPSAAGNPPAYWPSSGDLRVERLSARYSPDGPEVLHEISFHVKSGERIGVVGRTGSGKSSLTLSLLRCIYTSGDVFYDGIAISAINLDALRSQITIIPQIPELISGSLRENLDPFQENDDLTLNQALASAGLDALQEGLPERDKITLDTMVSSGGNNFSLGQRQILALARAIARRSKLLILDEDYKTDSIIQSSLRNQLGGDVTLITVAHRLQTIMDSDRIMVLDAGSIVSINTPFPLLA